MSGRHRRPEQDRLPGVDVAGEIVDGPVIEASQVGPLPSTVASPRPRRSHAAPGPPSAPPPPDLSARPDVPRAGSASAVSAATVTARRDRAAERTARRQASRRRVLQVLAVVLVLVLLAGAVWWVFFGRGDDETDSTAGAPASQETLLVQVAGADGTAAASALVGVTPSQRAAAMILVPSRLIVDVAGTGSVPFGETLALPDDESPSAALTDLLGVDVDDRWVLSTQALAALVDRVGGVQATVDVDVVGKDAKGQDVVVVRAGPQKLDGRSAAAYATYLAADEPEQARMARFNTVLEGVLAALPATETEIATAIGALGESSKSSLDAAALAKVLVVARNAAGKETLASDVLPVNEIDTGSGPASYGLNAGQAADLIRSRLPGAIQKDASGDAVRVLVENGVGTPGLVEKARGKLVDKGFRFVNGGNAATFDFDKSVVLIPDGSSESQERGQRVASALGLPDSAAQVSTRGQTVADVIVILGGDFKP